MRIAITGGRDYKPTRRDVQTFLRIFREMNGSALLHGNARGVDRYMAAVVRNELPCITIQSFPANWGLYGKGAGPIRNTEMLRSAESLIVFPGGKGTADCTRQARTLGLPVREVALEHPDPDAISPWVDDPPTSIAEEFWGGVDGWTAPPAGAGDHPKPGLRRRRS